MHLPDQQRQQGLTDLPAPAVRTTGHETPALLAVIAIASAAAASLDSLSANEGAMDASGFVPQMNQEKEVAER